MTPEQAARIVDAVEGIRLGVNILIAAVLPVGITALVFLAGGFSVRATKEER